jgi:hypothetical protein
LVLLLRLLKQYIFNQGKMETGLAGVAPKTAFSDPDSTPYTPFIHKYTFHCAALGEAPCA